MESDVYPAMGGANLQNGRALLVRPLPAQTWRKRKAVAVLNFQIRGGDFLKATS